MKDILITGTSGRLGARVVAAFAKTDYYLHLANRHQVEATGNQFSHRLDVTDAGAVKRAVGELAEGGTVLEAGINLTGGFMPGSLDQTGPEALEKMMHVNFTTAFNLVSALLPHFRKNGAGKFIFIGARMAGLPEVAGKVAAAYALSKQLLVPLVAMVNALGKEDHITAHLLLPGTIDSPEARAEMPDADFSKWTSPVTMAETMIAILDGREQRTEISF